MINDTNNKIKSSLKGSQRPENSGFIKAFILFLIIVAILVYYKINPLEVWNQILRPVIEWGFKLITNALEFIFKIAIWLVDKLKNYIPSK